MDNAQTDTGSPLTQSTMKAMRLTTRSGMSNSVVLLPWFERDAKSHVTVVS